MNLTDQELLVAAIVGSLRQIQSRRSPDRVPGIEEKRGGFWNVHIEGAAAEVAYAKATGRYWAFTVGTFDTPDVGPVEVKHTDGLEGRTSLLLRPEHDEDRLYALVVGRNGEYEVYAPLRGRDVKEQGEERDPGNLGRPCWMLSRERLRRIA